MTAANIPKTLRHEIYTYKEWYVKEDDNVNFFRDLVPDKVDGLEAMVFSTTDLDALKEKEKNLREKEEGKYFRCKLESLVFLWPNNFVNDLVSC